MFVVRTRSSSLGTFHAQDALAHFKAMARAGQDPKVMTVGGKALPLAGLERWIATVPRRFRPSA